MNGATRTLALASSTFPHNARAVLWRARENSKKAFALPLALGLSSVPAAFAVDVNAQPTLTLEGAERAVAAQSPMRALTARLARLLRPWIPANTPTVWTVSIAPSWQAQMSPSATSEEK
jgi:hypothetical protein